MMSFMVPMTAPVDHDHLIPQSACGGLSLTIRVQGAIR
jgi:hypothetical protein